MNQRNELAAVNDLADLIDDHAERSSYIDGGVANPREIANAILADGWTKHRTITTVEELEALGEDSVVVAKDKNVLTKARDGNYALHWWNAGDTEPWKASEITLPATVLHEGGAA